MRSLTGTDAFFFRTACQQTYGGSMPDAVLGATVVECEVDPPDAEGFVVVTVEVCCPLQ